MSPEQDPRTPDKECDSVWCRFANCIKPIGGLVAVFVGVVAVTGLALAALFHGGTTAATIASSAAGVIASIVGAFFGIKVGTDQTKQAAQGERDQAAKAAVYAAHLPPDQANAILGLAERVVRGEPTGK